MRHPSERPVRAPGVAAALAAQCQGSANSNGAPQGGRAGAGGAQHQAGAAGCGPPDPAPQGPGCPPASPLEELQPDVLYHVLACLGQRDVAHVKMCSSRLRSSILRACQHWAPKVESWLMSDPSSARLLKQLRGVGTQPLPADQPPPAAAAAAAAGGAHKLAVAGRTFAAVAAAAPAAGGPPSRQHAPARVAAAAACGDGAATLSRQLASAASAHALQPAPGSSGSGSSGSGSGSGSSSHAPDGTLVTPSLSLAGTKLDWRQVWSCLERAQQGPWQLDVRRLTPAAFPHGVLLTFELLLQQPAPPLEPGSQEQQAVGWRDSVTVLSFVLDGKAVEITVDAGGRVTSPQKDWCQGSITLTEGQPKLLALEVSYIFPVPAWYLHPCTLAAPKDPAGRASGGSCATHDASWDSCSLGTTSSTSTSTSSTSSTSSGSGGGGGPSSMSRAHSAALSCALSSLSFSSTTTGDGSSGGRSLAASSSGSGAGSLAAGGRPRLCLDLSHGLGSYVIDPRYIDDGARSQRPRGLERLELPGRVCWRPNKVQTWLGRLLPGIRSHHACSAAAAAARTGSASGCGGAGAAAGGAGGGAGACSGAPGAGASGCGGNGAAGGSSGSGGACSKPGLRPSFAVSVGKAAVWQVPEDPEYRFCEGFMFWAVQHKAEQLLGHYGILPPWREPPQGAAAAPGVRR